jgi:hypothetical protein
MPRHPLNWLLFVFMMAGACTRQPPQPRGYAIDIHIAATDLGSQLEKFVSAPDQPFLVIAAEGTPHFVQFSHAGDKAIMDFPLITDDQRSRADSIRRFAAKNGLEVELTSGTDGSEFIDMDVTLEPALLARLVNDAFATVFGIAKLDRLHLRGDPGR